MGRMSGQVSQEAPLVRAVQPASAADPQFDPRRLSLVGAHSSDITPDPPGAHLAGSAGGGSTAAAPPCVGVGHAGYGYGWSPGIQARSHPHGRAGWNPGGKIG